MAHFAKIDGNNRVEIVLVGRDEDDGKELELCERTGDHYRQTSYNTRGGVHYDAHGDPSVDQSKAFRKNFAGIGYIWDEARNAFYEPSPFMSWVLDEQTCTWRAPIPMPESDQYAFRWNEANQSWDAYKYNEQSNQFERVDECQM